MVIKMMSLHVLAAILLAISCPASAQACSKVLARDDGNASFPEPLIFHNLILEKSIAKLLEHWGPSLNKRGPVGKETTNSADQQCLVEEFSRYCRDTYGPTYRGRRGVCTDDVGMEYYCAMRERRGSQPSHSFEYCHGTATEPKKCVEQEVYNYPGRRSKLPYCAKIIRTKERAAEVDEAPEYDGHRTLPDEAKSLGTVDIFWMLGDQLGVQLSGLTERFEYRGNSSSGKEFRSQSTKKSHSWCCLGCPSETLHVSTIGFMSEVVGFDGPVWSWY